MFKFLSEDSKVSSMRVTLFLGTLCVCIMCMGVVVYLTIHAMKCTQLDWSGMSLFLGSISAFAGTLLYGKVQQKKVENKNTDTTTPTL